MPLNKSLRVKIDKLLEDWFRPHQDYIYNKTVTSNFLDDIEALISTELKNQREDIRSKLPGRKSVKELFPEADVNDFTEEKWCKNAVWVDRKNMYNQAIDQITKILDSYGEEG